MIRRLRCAMLLVPLLLAGTPALADGTAFVAGCRQSMSAAFCTCMVGELQKTRDGRLILGQAKIDTLPKAQQQEAFLALLKQLGMTNADLKDFAARFEPMHDAAIKRCQ